MLIIIIDKETVNVFVAIYRGKMCVAFFTSIMQSISCHVPWIMSAVTEAVASELRHFNSISLGKASHTLHLLRVPPKQITWC